MSPGDSSLVKLLHSLVIQRDAQRRDSCRCAARRVLSLITHRAAQLKTTFKFVRQDTLSHAAIQYLASDHTNYMYREFKRDKQPRCRPYSVKILLRQFQPKIMTKANFELRP